MRIFVSTLLPAVLPVAFDAQTDSSSKLILTKVPRVTFEKHNKLIAAITEQKV